MIKFFYFFAFAFFSSSVFGQTSSTLSTRGQAPEEYEIVGAQSHGLADAGIVSNASLDSVRLNPAMLATTKDYRLAAGYTWPVVGRDFYQVGVVDSKSSKVSAAVQYTGFTARFGETKRWEGLDSPVLKRMALAGAAVLGQMAVGLGGQYIEGVIPDPEDLGGRKVLQDGRLALEWSFR